MPHPERLPHNFFDDAAPFQIDGVYCKLIPLTRGQFTIVDLLDYEPLSIHTWCAWWNPKTATFYAIRNTPRIKGKRTGSIYMHREVVGLLSGDKREVDHRRVKTTLDNRRGNLRIATRAQNARNRMAQSNNRSGVKGVFFCNTFKAWFAAICVDGKRTRKRASSKDEAAAIYAGMARLHHGEFSNLGRGSIHVKS